jgi:hypothetical protein
MALGAASARGSSGRGSVSKRVEYTSDIRRLWGRRYITLADGRTIRRPELRYVPEPPPKGIAAVVYYTVIGILLTSMMAMVGFTLFVLGRLILRSLFG